MSGRVQPDVDLRVIGSLRLAPQVQGGRYGPHRELGGLAAEHDKRPDFGVAARADDEQGDLAACGLQRGIGIDDGSQLQHPAQTVLGAGDPGVLCPRPAEGDAPGLTLEVHGAQVAATPAFGVALGRQTVGVQAALADAAHSLGAGSDTRALWLLYIPSISAVALLTLWRVGKAGQTATPAHSR